MAPVGVVDAVSNGSEMKEGHDVAEEDKNQGPSEGAASAASAAGSAAEEAAAKAAADRAAAEKEAAARAAADEKAAAQRQADSEAVYAKAVAIGEAAGLKVGGASRMGRVTISDADTGRTVGYASGATLPIRAADLDRVLAHVIGNRG